MEQNPQREIILSRIRDNLGNTISSMGHHSKGYYHSPEGICKFVREIIGATPTPYQEEILFHFVQDKRVAVRAPHGVGKSCLSSWAVGWLMGTTPPDVDVKVITTAGSWRQLTHFLWPEITKWTLKANWAKLGVQVRPGRELLTLSWRLPGKEAFAVASDNPGLIEGAHATVVAYIFDESKVISDDTFDAAEGAFSQEGIEGKEAYALATSTPGDKLGRFYDIHSRKPGLRNWWTKHITLQEAIDANQIGEKWANEKKELWGEDSEVYQRRVLGEFASSGESTVIPLSWIEESNELYLAWEESGEELTGEEAIGCDPARFGEDRTTVCTFRDFIVTSLQSMAKMDTMAIANYLMEMDKAQKKRFGIDVIGLGAGVVDRMREKNFSVIGVNVSEVSGWTDVSGELEFLNLRSALWWFMREYLDPQLPRGIRILLPPHDDLTTELTRPTWKEVGRGMIKVEGKDEIRKRLKGKSTDHADCIMIALYIMLVGSSHGIYV